jgi:hypothetical protein
MKGSGVGLGLPTWEMYHGNNLRLDCFAHNNIVVVQTYNPRPSSTRQHDQITKLSPLVNVVPHANTAIVRVKMTHTFHHLYAMHKSTRLILHCRRRSHQRAARM